MKHDAKFIAMDASGSAFEMMRLDVGAVVGVVGEMRDGEFYDASLAPFDFGGRW